MTGDKRAHAGNKSSVLEMLKNELDRAVKKDVVIRISGQKVWGKGWARAGRGWVMRF